MSRPFSKDGEQIINKHEKGVLHLQTSEKSTSE